jgi:cellulose synthase/poly-beta-1,6-N-acetylglucosamine synthase-like glycosyltransferase
MPQAALIDVAYLVFALISLYMSFLFLLLWNRNRSQLRASPVSVALPSISVLVPAYNEERTITGTLEALRCQDYPKDKLNVIVIDDGSTDRTADVVRQFGGVILLKKPNGGKASALNVGLAAADGEMVACVDSDSRPAPDSLRKIIPFFSDPKVAAVTTSIFIREPKNLIQRLQRIEYIMIVWARKLLEFLDSIYVTPGPLSVYRTSVLRKVGGFDEKNLTEDIEIAWRLMHAGYAIKMATDAEVDTAAPYTFKNWWRQRMRWNIGGIQTTVKYRHTLFRRGFGALGTFVIPFFAASYIISMLGLFVFAYIIVKSLADFVMFSLATLGAGANPVHAFELILMPDVFTIFGVLIFLLSLVWIRISLKAVHKPIGGLRSIPDLLLYLVLYITVFPINLFQSSIRFITVRDHDWTRYSSVA